MTDTTQQPNRLMIILSIVFSVLTLTTIGFGVSTAALLGRGASASAPSPTPTPTSAADTAQYTSTVDGFEISALSDLVVKDVTLAVDALTGRPGLYAFLTNEEDAEAAQGYFDVTAYREDGSIVERMLDIVYIPPGQTGVLQVQLPEDLGDTVSIVIEQTGIDMLPPAITGTVAVDSVESTGRDDRLDVVLTSELSPATEFTEIFLAAYRDEELVGLCTLNADIPASGSAFEGSCRWSPTAVEDPVTADALPDDVEFEAYLKLEEP